MKTINDFLSKKNIHCDMDGVLTNFEQAVIDLGHGNIKEIENKGKDLLWKIIYKRGVSFWSEMQWMPDGKRLWEYIKKYKPSILTAMMAGNKHCIEGKRVWVKKQLGWQVPVVVCLRKEKENYSNSNSILIDDKDKNIIEWQQKDGIGIYHKNARNTIIQLKKILK